MKKERTHTLEYCRTEQHQLTTNQSHLAQLLDNRKFRTTLLTAQKSLLTGIDRDQVKESLHERQKQQAQHYNRSSGPPLPPLHDGQHICLYDSCSKTYMAAGNNPCRDRRLHLDPTQLNQAQLAPFTAAQENSEPPYQTQT